MPPPNSRKIVEIEDTLHAEGYKPGTPQFDFLFVKRKIDLCQETRGVPSCQSCPVVEFCSLAADHFKTLAEIERQHHVRKMEEAENVKKGTDPT